MRERLATKEWDVKGDIGPNGRRPFYLPEDCGSWTPEILAVLGTPYNCPSTSDI